MLLLLFCLSAVVADVPSFVRDYASDGMFRTPVFNFLDCSDPVEMMRSVAFGMKSSPDISVPLQNWVNVMEIQTFVVNVGCPEAESVLKQGNDLDLFRMPFRWLLLNPSAFAEEDNSTGQGRSSDWHWEALRELNVLLDSEVRVTERGEDGAVRILEAHKTSQNGELNVVDLAEWSPQGGLRVHSRDCTAIRRWDLGGIPLMGSIVVTHADTVDHLEDMIDKYKDPISKVGYTMHKHLAEMINASLKFTIRDTWGENQNGTWTGLLGDLQSGIADVGMSPAFVTKERLPFVDYHEMIASTRTKFIFLSPPLSFSKNIFTMPFHWMVWMCCLIMMAVSCSALYITITLEDGYEREGGNVFGSRRLSDVRGRDQRPTPSYGEIILINIGAICVQGTASAPKGPSGRVLELFLYFSYMFLYVSYSGSIVALLQSSDTSITTFSNLLSSPLKVAADDVVYSQYYFKIEKEPIRKALYEKKIIPPGEKPHFVSPEEGIKNLRKGLYAYHVETSVAYSLIQKTFTEEEKCGLQEFKLSFIKDVDPYCMMKKNSQFREHVRIGMKRMIERGINHRTVGRIYTRKPRCSARGSRFVSVGLIDCYPAFMMLVCGTGIACCALLAEKIARRWIVRT